MNLYRVGVAVVTILMSVLSISARPRMIVMSDIGGSDPDDTQSLVHLLVSLDQVELIGIISQHAWVPYGSDAVDLINSVIDGYEKCLPNLRVHSADFPDAGYLRSIVKVGQTEAAMKGVGAGKDSEGSEWIIREVDKSDSRPVWISAWSGLNTLAQALWKVEQTRTPEETARFVNKLRVYDVLGQDDAGAWITNKFPNLIYIRNSEIYGWGPDDLWIKTNVQNVGPLGELYPDRKWASEGDSPGYMYCLENGLNEPERPEWGSWGGRFDVVQSKGLRGMDWVKINGLDESQYDPYYMISPSEEGSLAIIRWKDAIYNDFAARMQWSVSPEYQQANHHPIAYVGNDKSKDIIELFVNSGATITLDSAKSYDADGNALTYKWVFYREPSTYKRQVALDGAHDSKCAIRIPADSAGKTIHIVLEVTDNGVPALTAYRRVVLNVI